MDIAITKALPLSELVDDLLGGDVTVEERRYFSTFARQLPSATFAETIEELREQLRWQRPADPARFCLAALLAAKCRLSTQPLERTCDVLASEEDPANKPVFETHADSISAAQTREAAR